MASRRCREAGAAPKPLDLVYRYMCIMACMEIVGGACVSSVCSTLSGKACRLDTSVREMGPDGYALAAYHAHRFHTNTRKKNVQLCVCDGTHQNQTYHTGQQPIDLSIYVCVGNWE